MILEYVGLDDDPRQIRLLDLHPGIPQDEIRFTLRHVRLAVPKIVERKRLTKTELQQTLPPGWVAAETSQYRYRFLFEDVEENTTWTHPVASCDPLSWQELGELPPAGFQPAFEALSYTWGSEQDPETASVDYQYPSHNPQPYKNRQFKKQITQNLAAALRALRDQKDSRTLWVDAVCIDQKNHLERSSQVKHMSQVYKLAQRVIVWLGPSTSSTSIAISTLAYLGSQLEVSRSRVRFRSPEATEPEWFRASTPLPYDSTTWQAIDELLRRSWFERLWTWQEIQLANSCAAVVCGTHQIQWQCLRKAVICLYSKDELPSSELRRRLEIMDPLMDEGLASSAHLLLNMSRQRFCSEPKDHIYGMLSICGPKLASKIKPDYDRSVMYYEVFKEVFLKYLDQVNRLDLLSGCEDRSQKHTGPTWVPDWSVARTTCPLYAFAFASGVSRSETRYVAPNNLQVDGVKVATISKILQTMPMDFANILKSLRDTEPADLRTRTYPTGETLLDAYCAVLRAGFLRERWTIYVGPSLEEWKAQYLGIISSLAKGLPVSAESIDSAEVFWCLKLLRGRTVFETQDGYVGIGPPSARSGDTVCVLLGSKVPMLLRPFSDVNESGFTVIGECYIHGLDDGVTLLGSLPSGWRIQVGKASSTVAAVHSYKNLVTNEVAEEDPRLAALPEDWKKINRESEHDDPVLFQIYRNCRTGEEINYDPRMTVNELRRQRIKVQTFSLY